MAVVATRAEGEVGLQYQRARCDGNGTLADTFPWVLRAPTRRAEAHGCNRVAAGDVDTLRGSSARRVGAHLGIPLWKRPRIGIDMRRRLAADIGQICLCDGTGAMLRGLSERGVASAVVTSNACDNVRRVLGADHAALIRHYACGASLFGKRGHMRRVLQESGVRPGEPVKPGAELGAELLPLVGQGVWMRGRGSLASRVLGRCRHACSSCGRCPHRDGPLGPRART
jgi:phosphoglycolate phosphatase